MKNDKSKYIKRLNIIGIIGIIYSIILIADNFLSKIVIWQMALACTLFIFSIFFVIASKKLSERLKKESNKKSTKK